MPSRINGKFAVPYLTHILTNPDNVSVDSLRNLPYMLKPLTSWVSVLFGLTWWWVELSAYYSLRFSAGMWQLCNHKSMQYHMICFEKWNIRFSKIFKELFDSLWFENTFWNVIQLVAANMPGNCLLLFEAFPKSNPLSRPKLSECTVVYSSKKSFERQTPENNKTNKWTGSETTFAWMFYLI